MTDRPEDDDLSPDLPHDDDDGDAADTGGRPVIRLKPRQGRRMRSGAPWVWQDELVLDRRTRKLAPGALAELQDSDRNPIGLVTANVGATLAARLLDANPAAEIDRAWIHAKLSAAHALRARLFDAPFYRLVHAEGDFLPGMIIDRFGDAAVIQPNATWANERIDEIASVLMEITGVSTVVMNGTSRVRAIEGLPEETRILHGALDGPIAVPMNGATYMADLVGGQKTGLFFDQRPNHAFVAGLSKGARVLDMFSHVGGFSLAALAAGASEAFAVDGSAAALALAEAGAAHMGVSGRFTTRKSDAFDALRILREEGETFDVVVCDPPAFAPTKSAFQNGVRAYEKVARFSSALVAPGGFLTLCSCSHAVDAEAFHGASTAGIRHAGREASLIFTGRAGPDHPVHISLPETSYLKAFTYRLS
ncbi:MAG: 23S rRNA (cytosine1962-C5)-methyltransferase [Paracoccaceae bacterium]|jgi:23S rRNA (cytosine1962-C5)-methyltransferase